MSEEYCLRYSSGGITAVFGGEGRRGLTIPYFVTKSLIAQHNQYIDVAFERIPWSMSDPYGGASYGEGMTQH